MHREQNMPCILINTREDRMRQRLEGRSHKTHALKCKAAFMGTKGWHKRIARPKKKSLEKNESKISDNAYNHSHARSLRFFILCFFGKSFHIVPTSSSFCVGRVVLSSDC